MRALPDADRIAFARRLLELLESAGTVLEKYSDEFSQERLVSIDPAKRRWKVHGGFVSRWFFWSEVHRSSTIRAQAARENASLSPIEFDGTRQVLASLCRHYREFTLEGAEKAAGVRRWLCGVCGLSCLFGSKNTRNQTDRMNQVNQTVVGAARAWCCRTVRSRRDRRLYLLAVQSVGALA
jgi:hypothetical protein